MISAETVVVTWLTSNFPTARVVTETPAQMADDLPVIKVAAIGGGRTLNLGLATVDVECYDATREASRTLAGQVNDSLMYLMRGTIAGSTVSSVATVSMPAYRPYDNTNLRRFGLTIQVALRDAVPTLIIT